jgi:hypothetical protein
VAFEDLLVKLPLQNNQKNSFEEAIVNALTM